MQNIQIKKPLKQLTNQEYNMQMVDGKKFPYTAKGKMDAKKEMKKKMMKKTAIKKMGKKK